MFDQPPHRIGKARSGFNFSLPNRIFAVRDALSDRAVFIPDHMLGLAAHCVRSARFSRYRLPVIPAWERRSTLDLVLPAPIRVDRVYASLSHDSPFPERTGYPKSTGSNRPAKTRAQ
jgi:hypothetical protein